METLPALRQRQDRPGGQLRLTLDVPTDLSVFEGHFPEQPVLPGVTQIDWAARLACAHLDCCRPVTRIEALKFRHVVIPPAHVDLELTHQPTRNAVQFVYASADDQIVYASGRLHFAE